MQLPISYPNIPVICGATASGKSRLAMNICRRTGGELVSLDSMQIYRKMDIGTAKPSLEEQKEIPHHMIDILDPDETYSTALFQKDAYDAIDTILKKGKLPVLCGGTGQYVQALALGLLFVEIKENPDIRRELEEQMRELGPDILYEKLCKTDPVAAQNIHPQNKRRVLRALEIFRLTGIPMSRHNELSRKDGPRYPFSLFSLQREREDLYYRIENRVDLMIADGWEEETKSLLESEKSLSRTASQAIGYRELTSFLQGDIDRAQAVEKIKLRTRNYAKRQITWFSHMEDRIPISPDDEDSVLRKIES